MKKLLLITFLLVYCFSQTVQAQSGKNILIPKNENTKINFSKWTYGGSIGIGGSFGTNGGYNISLNPHLGYMLTDKLNLGASFLYNFQSQKNYSTHIVGIGPELNYYTNNLYFTTEFQYNFVSGKNFVRESQSYQHREKALYVGGGYIQKIGNHLRLQVGMKYNVLYDKDKSIFNSGFIPSVGITTGF